MMDKLRPAISKVVFGIALVNFFALVFVATYIGGDAINGMIKDGHFFLAMHGKYTEVDEHTFNLSRWHVYSVFFTHTLAGVVGYWNYRANQKKPT